MIEAIEAIERIRDIVSSSVIARGSIERGGQSS
jgi:hypothetical protein